MVDTPVVLDFEGFRYRNKEWIIKEIGVAADYVDSLIFKEPFSLETLPSEVQRAYKWLTQNLHGLNWTNGDYSYDRLTLFVESIKLRYPQSIYYAKGHEKTVHLSLLFSKNVQDLDEIGCPKVENLPNTITTCSNKSQLHSYQNHCARQKAEAFSIWLANYNKNDKSENSNFKKRSIRHIESRQ